MTPAAGRGSSRGGSPVNERVAVVTGANRGLGLETARRLAGLGYTVVLTSRNATAGAEAAAAIGASAGRVVPHPLDVTSEPGVARLRTFVEETFGRVDVLVNNAAVFLDEGRSVLDVETEIYRVTIDVNVLGPLRTCRALVPLMIERGYGRVVNVSSGAGRLADMTDDTPAYSLSKTALHALTVLFADAVKGRDILVNAVCPGWVRTDMGGPSAPRSVEEGAEGIVWLATLPGGGPTGGLFRDKQRVSW
jgi:NAD(P)-dependent dehydrogenase (short-subunit alcohol dehydrogenase family)